MLVEQREQERVAQPTAEQYSTLHIALQRIAPAHHDQRTRAVARQFDDGPHQRIGGLWVRLFWAAPPKADRRDSFEEPTKLALEDHDQDDHQDCEEALEEPGGELHSDLAGREIRRDQDAHAAEGRPGPSRAQRYDTDVDHS